MAKNWTFLGKMVKKIFFSKNAAQREIFFNIGQYFLVFCEKVVSIWSVFCEKVVSIVVSIPTFFFTDHSCHHCYSLDFSKTLQKLEVNKVK